MSDTRPAGRRTGDGPEAAMTRRGWWLFGALQRHLGVPYLLIKVAVPDLDPVVVAFGRIFLGALLLRPITVRRRSLAPVLRR